MWSPVAQLNVLASMFEYRAHLYVALYTAGKSRRISHIPLRHAVSSSSENFPVATQLTVRRDGIVKVSMKKKQQWPRQYRCQRRLRGGGRSAAGLLETAGESVS